MAVTWMKAKYSNPKPKGTNQGGHNHSGKASHRKGRIIFRQPQKDTGLERVLILGPTGKRRWAWQASD